MFLEYFSILIHNKFHSILQKNGQENGNETTFSSKMHNGENAFEVLLYIYINNASITSKDAFSV